MLQHSAGGWRQVRRGIDLLLRAVGVLCSIVHQHVFEVMKLAFKEILTSEEQTEKAFVLWSTFVEPMFGLQPHQREEWELDQKQSNAAQQHHLRRNPSLRATALSGQAQPSCILAQPAVKLDAQARAHL